MSGFEFTPDGMVPLGTYREGQKVGTIATATANVPGPLSDEERQAFGPLPSSPRAPLSYPSKPTTALAPKDVIRLARARLKDVEREIRRIRKLETERDELKRLLDAAAGKPMAVVRSLPTRSAKSA